MSRTSNPSFSGFFRDALLSGLSEPTKKVFREAASIATGPVHPAEIVSIGLAHKNHNTQKAFELWEMVMGDPNAPSRNRMDAASFTILTADTTVHPSKQDFAANARQVLSDIAIGGYAPAMELLSRFGASNRSPAPGS